jgi:cytochrome c oxidase subunit 4
MTTGHPGEHGRHPTFKQYLMVATILFIITLVEFFIIYPQQRITGAPLVVALVGLSAIKFAIVIMFYMHLKFDTKLFSYIFVGGLALALAVGLALLGLFGSLRAEAQPREFAQENRVPYEHPAAGEHPEGGAMEPKPDAGMMPGADAEKLALGKAVFIGKGTCFACHAIDGVSTGSVGPNLTHIGTAGAMHRPGMSSEAYIRESVEDPSAFVAQGYPDGVMTKGLKNTMSEAEFEALVAFLLAQK